MNLATELVNAITFYEGANKLQSNQCLIIKFGDDTTDFMCKFVRFFRIKIVILYPQELNVTIPRKIIFLDRAETLFNKIFSKLPKYEIGVFDYSPHRDIPSWPFRTGYVNSLSSIKGFIGTDIHVKWRSNTKAIRWNDWKRYDYHRKLLKSWFIFLIQLFVLHFYS